MGLHWLREVEGERRIMGAVFFRQKEMSEGEITLRKKGGGVLFQTC